jgi:3-deoxy-D-manno-octulosonic-acid transferase
MPFVYDLATGLYHMGIRAMALSNPKARKWVRGRHGLWDRLKQKAPQLQGCLWMHCSSLGEFEQGRPVLEELKRLRPEMPVLLTFYSPSGYEVMKDAGVATHVEYLPPDGAGNARRLLDMVAPAAAIFVKYEFWFHYLDQLSKRRTPTFLISARFRPEQPFFKWYGGTHKRMLQCFTHMFVQDERSVDLLRSIGTGNATCMGDPRFDRVAQILERNEELPMAGEFRSQADGPVLICGSTWPQDESVLFPAFSMLKKMPALIIAPHELDGERVEKLVKKVPAPASFWTAGSLLPGSRTLVIDTIGPLARAYRYGDVAYVGGGFVDGIHNLLEAAAWGVPVIFGPNHHKFSEAKGLIEAGGGFTIRNSEELAMVLERLLTDDGARKKAGAAAAAYVRRNIGAAQGIGRALNGMF